MYQVFSFITVNQKDTLQLVRFACASTLRVKTFRTVSAFFSSWCFLNALSFYHFLFLTTFPDSKIPIKSSSALSLVQYSHAEDGRPTTAVWCILVLGGSPSQSCEVHDRSVSNNNALTDTCIQRKFRFCFSCEQQESQACDSVINIIKLACFWCGIHHFLSST